MMVTKSARFIWSWLLEKISTHINITDLIMFIKDKPLSLRVMNWKVSEGIKDTRLSMSIKVNGKEEKVGGVEKEKKKRRKEERKGRKKKERKQKKPSWISNAYPHL